MDSLNINSKILYTNAKNFGIDLTSLYKSSANLIAKEILEKYGKNKEFCIICGLAGNGGDGFALAQELIKDGNKVYVYLVGRGNNIEDPVAFELWEELKKIEDEKLVLKQDCYAKDIQSSDIIVECLIGTGFVGGKLNKRFGDVIKRISHFKKETIAIDLAATSYKPDLTISLFYPKTTDAEVINISLPKELTMYPGPGEEEVLFKPKKHSYKVKNGKLLYIFNSKNVENLEKLFKFAEDYFVHIDVYSLQKIEFNSNKNFCTILKDEDLEDSISSADTIYLDQFDNPSLINKALITEIINSFDKNFIISNSAMQFIPAHLLKPLSQKVFILDKNNLEKFNTNNRDEKGYKRISIEFKTNLIIPSVQSYLYSSTGEFRLDITGKLYNKDLQQDLLNLTAVLSTKNDMWLSLRAADFMLVGI